MEEQNITIGNSEDKDKYRNGYLSVYLDITDKCNLNCSYCYAKNKSKKCLPLVPSLTKPTLENFKLIASKFKDKKDKKIFFELSGGEILLRPDWEEICEIFLETGKEVYIYSNAILMDNKNVSKMVNLFNKYPNKIGFCSSLDSFQSETHNLLRGNIDKTLSGLKRLKAEGIETKICVTLTSHNKNDMPKILSKIAKEISKEIILSFLRPVFPIDEDAKKLFVPYSEVLDLTKKLTRVADKEEWNLYSPLHGDGKTYCEAGMNRILISTNGDISPCYCLRLKKYKVGNIYKNSLKEIFDKIDEFNNRRDTKILLCEHQEDVFGIPPVRMEQSK